MAKSKRSMGFPPSYGGVVPSLCLTSDLSRRRTECGVGALMPWAGSLWAISYVSSKAPSGGGTGLYEIDENLRMTRRPESVVGTYANRMVHYPSQQMIIGPHVIDERRKVRTIKPLVDVRLGGVMEHLSDPANMVYFLGMEGEFFEVNVHDLKVTPLFDLRQELKLRSPARVHFKAGYTCFGRVVVADNMYDEETWSGRSDDGRLAEWDGKTWTILERKPFVEVMGRREFAPTMFASGWDRASAILQVYTHADRTWRRYRLPKASHTFDHAWQTEWPRIREVEHERFLLDHHGMFYELSPWAYGNRVWGLRPISTHLWVIPDFCSYRGLLVMGSDNASPAAGENILTAEPQSGLWVGKTDDLWQFGKPSGWGGPWWDDPVRAGEPSDPYLMTGFMHKCIHLTAGGQGGAAFTIEVDIKGCGDWHKYRTIDVSAGGYECHVFPAGFSAHWVRVVADRDCTATAQLAYT